MANQNQKKNQNKDQNKDQNKNQTNQTGNTQNTDSAKHKNQEKSNKSQKDNGFDAGAFLELVKKYKRYIAAGVLFVAMVLALVKCTGPAKNVPADPVQEEQTDDQADLTEEFQVDAIPEINTLIADYYKAYQDGDVDALETLAQPISDTEKSYIKLFSDYVESYDNLSCYTKSGLGDGEYVVSVYLEMKFKGVDTKAPGLDFFYVRTDETGKPYIDNAYSQFNQSNMENSTQADVQALINEFEQADDVVALQQEVQQKYDQAIESDQQLATMANETIPNAISEWVQSLTQADADNAEQPSDKDTDTSADDTASDDQNNADDQTQQKDDQNTDDSASDQTDSEDTSEKQSDGKAKTAYALDGINLRKGPGTDKKVVTQIALGDKLKIYPDTKKNGWVKASYKKKKGYVKLEYVTTKKSDIKGTTTEDEPAKALPEGKEITLSDSVNVRVSMSETADKVGLAFQGDTVKVIQSYAEGWTKVEWNGETGYIKTELIK